MPSASGIPPVASIVTGAPSICLGMCLRVPTVSESPIMSTPAFAWLAALPPPLMPGGGGGCAPGASVGAVGAVPVGAGVGVGPAPVAFWTIPAPCSAATAAASCLTAPASASIALTSCGDATRPGAGAAPGATSPPAVTAGCGIVDDMPAQEHMPPRYGHPRHPGMGTST